MSDSESLSYQYKDLDHDSSQIRLVKLHHQPDGTKDITCTIKHVDRNDEPVFTALSYEWGLPPSTAFVRVANSNDPALVEGTSLPIILVRENLTKFLKIKQKDAEFCESTWLWIDQICINQNNIKEKNHQVWQMADIYSEAAKVIAWLGPGFPGSDELCDSFTVLSDREWREEDRCHLDEMFILFKNLFSRTYWNRLWICQELVMARDVRFQVGNHHVNLFSRQSPFRFYSRERDKLGIFRGYGSEILSVSKGYYQFQRIKHTRGKFIADFENARSWSQALYLASFAYCGESRDKIYALSGLLDPKTRLEPDYEISLKELCLQAATLRSEEEERTNMHRVMLNLSSVWLDLDLIMNDRGNLRLIHLFITERKRMRSVCNNARGMMDEGIVQTLRLPFVSWLEELLALVVSLVGASILKRKRKERRLFNGLKSILRMSSQKAHSFVVKWLKEKAEKDPETWGLPGKKEIFISRIAVFVYNTWRSV